MYAYIHIYILYINTHTLCGKAKNEQDEGKRKRTIPGLVTISKAHDEHAEML